MASTAPYVEPAASAADRQFRAVFEGALDAMLLADDAARYVDANPAACTLFGIERAELVGRSLLDFIAPEGQAAARDGWGLFLETGRQSGEIALALPSGVTRHVEFRATAHVTPGRHLSVIRDVSELKQLTERLQQSVQTRDDILAYVSHDLRNPLSAITMSAALLRRALPPDEKTERALNNIVRAADRMTRLISDLLDLSRLESGRIALDVKSYDGASLAAEAVDLLQSQAAARGLVLQRTGEPAPVNVRCDRDRVLQVLTNLVGNAIKYAARGTITISTAASPEGTRFQVADEGPGIAAAELPRLYDRYWQSRPQDRSGLGLGLAIVRGLVEAHGGQLGVESTLGAGSTFWFTLPA